jgi:hypothetical protein
MEGNMGGGGEKTHQFIFSLYSLDILIQECNNGLIMYLGCREYTKRIVVGNSGKQLFRR